VEPATLTARDKELVRLRQQNEEYGNLDSRRLQAENNAYKERIKELTLQNGISFEDNRVLEASKKWIYSFTIRFKEDNKRFIEENDMYKTPTETHV
jgi:hypothetical protein